MSHIHSSQACYISSYCGHNRFPQNHISNIRYTSNRRFSHFTPERKMHASAKFKGRAQSFINLHKYLPQSWSVWSRHFKSLTTRRFMVTGFQKIVECFPNISARPCGKEQYQTSKGLSTWGNKSWKKTVLESKENCLGTTSSSGP